jgi:hypothetical protein
MMTMNDQEMLPLYARKKAESMTLDGRGKILFTLIVPSTGIVAKCEWLDPSFGMFCPEGKGNTGFMMIRDLPEGSLICGQRFEDEDER